MKSLEDGKNVVDICAKRCKIRPVLSRAASV